MLPVSQNKLKKLKKQLLKLQEQKESLLLFVLDKYKAESLDFHRIFLHSGFIMALDLSEVRFIRDTLLKSASTHGEINRDWEFILHLVKKKHHMTSS